MRFSKSLDKQINECCFGIHEQSDLPSHRRSNHHSHRLLNDIRRLINRRCRLLHHSLRHLLYSCHHSFHHLCLCSHQMATSAPASIAITMAFAASYVASHTAANCDSVSFGAENVHGLRRTIATCVHGELDILSFTEDMISIRYDAGLVEEKITVTVIGWVG
ncbi:unnamed protein product [Cuscuta europaea]|uniref:Uncharacterized protein n=1 Tax=Cuscuta europaea TaxID=41803 RepID=A0A9P1EAN8_CUSEU|nr:unnamed protein product [Cuscuta europaea]